VFEKSSNEQLLALYKQDDNSAAIGEVFDRFKKFLDDTISFVARHYSLKVTEDLTQDCYIDFIYLAKTYKEEESHFAHYIKRYYKKILLRTLRDHFEDRKQRSKQIQYEKAFL